MNKYVKYSVIFAGVLFGLWILGRTTNAFQYYKAPSQANEPNIAYKSHFFASNLVTPKRFDFVCYKADLPQMGRYTVVHRLCGLPGDTIEIRNGDLFVNNQFADESFSVMHPYRMPFHEFNRVRDMREIDDEEINQFTPDSVELRLPTDFVRDNKINARRKVLPQERDEFIGELFSGNYNQDHFGPVIVPEGKFFFLGDNRHGSQDSRYLGFIDQKEYVATVLWK
jgi:signal peptidase I